MDPSAPEHDARTGLSDEQLEAVHTPDAIRDRLERGPKDSYLRDCVYGAIDGAVTTFAVVSGVAGAGLSPRVIVILGVANLIGDGFSMAAGNFLGTRTEREERARLRRIEEEHIRRHPEGEREEIRQIFASQGFSGDDLDRAVKIVSSDRDRWVSVMLREEHGLSGSPPNPWRAAAATFLSFLVIGLIPLLPFLIGIGIGLDHQTTYRWSVGLTAAAFFAVGAVKSRFVGQSSLTSGFEAVFIGGSAAALAFLCGYLLRPIG